MPSVRLAILVTAAMCLAVVAKPSHSQALEWLESILIGKGNRSDPKVDPIVAGFSAGTCAATVPTQRLRHGFGYRFWDQFNTSDRLVEYRFVGQPRVFFAEEYDLNGSPSFPAFGWTVALREKEFIVGPAQTLKYVEADATYPVTYRPKERRVGNLSIAFSAEYYARKLFSETWYGPYYTLSCQKYEVTWCGDGFVDTEEGEECDEGAGNSESGRCSSTCKRH